MLVLFLDPGRLADNTGHQNLGSVVFGVGKKSAKRLL